MWSLCETEVNHDSFGFCGLYVRLKLLGVLQSVHDIHLFVPRLELDVSKGLIDVYLGIIRLYGKSALSAISQTVIMSDCSTDIQEPLHKMSTIR